MEKITKSSDKVLIDPNEPLILPDGTALVGRVEWFLYALCCLDYQNLPTPMSRIEEFANALITGEIPNIQPQSRAEQFFLAILDGNISDLPQPQSRSEVLLDKLARGEFDLSDVEPIQSRYELLLAYLIKNGGIGNIDYVLYEFSEAMKTMYNTVEKPFKSLELSGNTLVNCVLEDTENDDYTSFDKDYSGTSFTINGTSEGAIKSAILSGNTLVNVKPKTSLSKWGTSSYDSESGICTLNGSNSGIRFNIDLLKTSTKYLVIFDIVELPTFAVESDAPIKLTLGHNSYNYLNINSDELKVGTLIKTITTHNEFTEKISIGNRGEFSTPIKMRFMIIEYQEGIENWDIPYFEGLQSVKMPVLKTTGKNIFNKETVKYNTIIDSGGNETPNDYYVSSDFVPVKENTTYYTKGLTVVIGYDVNKQSLGYLRNYSFDGSFLTPNNCKYVRIRNFSALDDLDSQKTWIETVQFEEGSTATPYEPFKSNILTVNEDVTLRGFGGVQDTLDCLTGEVVQNIYEFTMDGSQRIDRGDNMFYYYVPFPVQNNRSISDKFPSITVGQILNGVTGISAQNRGNASRVYININGITTKEDMQNYFLNNPTTIQLVLSNKSIKTVDLNVVDQNNTKIDKIHVFDEVTHVNTSSDELTPTVNIGKSVSYPTIIKPNTKYTVDLKRNDKPLTVNLGGTEVTFVDGETRKTITTPSTLTNDKLSYYGVGAKCNEIMLIEGEIERNVDYFTGMQSVVMQNQMPILYTVGKNLFDGAVTKSSIDVTTGEIFPNENSVWFATDYIDVKDIKSLCFQTGYMSNLNVVYMCFDSNKKFIGYKGFYNSLTGVINPLENTHYIRLRLDCTIDLSTTQIEQGTQATSYEPYKSSILSCNDDVTLRGIGEVQDTLDCLRGELTERISEIVLDGSEEWTLFDMHDVDGYSTFVAIIPTLNNYYDSSTSFISADFATGSWGSYLKNKESEIVYNHDPNKIGIRVKSEKASNVEEIKEFLSTNNIRINYKLATESIKAVDLNVVDQDGNTIPKIKSYNSVTHLEVTVPKQSLLPNVSAEVATDNSKDMSSLTTKHQEISEAQSAIQDNIQSQSDEIDTALMTTTEIFESILE